MKHLSLLLAQDDVAGAAKEPGKLAEAATGLWKKLMNGQFDQITGAEVWEVAAPVLLAIVLIIVLFMVARTARKITVKAATKAHVEITLAKFFGNLVRWAILLMGAITILQTIGVEATSFAAVAAALGFAIGMALSGTLGNVASGVMLLIFRPFKVGDVVNVAGVIGKVNEIELFTTTIDTPDNRRIIIPNNSIVGSTIENISHHDIRRVDVTVGTDYGADIDKARETLHKAIETIPQRLQEPESAVVLTELGGSSIDWSVRVWVNAGDFWPVKDALTRAVKIGLDEASIGIPFPQMDVHMDGKLQKD